MISVILRVLVDFMVYDVILDVQFSPTYHCQIF